MVNVRSAEGTTALRGRAVLQLAIQAAGIRLTLTGGEVCLLLQDLLQSWCLLLLQDLVRTKLLRG
jgi:hypothetical protein